MFVDAKLERFAATLRERNPVPLRLRLWDGRVLDLHDAARATAVATIVVPTLRGLRRLMSPSLSNLGRAYVEGEIEVEGRLRDAIDGAWSLARRMIQPGGRLGRIVRKWKHTRESDRRDIEYHYDVSNEFYRLILDENLVYSCAYFARDDLDLARAQLAKIDHILTKLRVGPDDRMLDIGCGWGALVIRAAQTRGARCLGVTLSQRQFEWARQRVNELGLADRVSIELRDYRDLLPQHEGAFDRIASVGMFEHVGLRHLPDYFTTVRRLLRDGGLVLNHGITSTDAGDGETPYGGGEFIHRYVFPHGELAHIGTVLKALQRGGLEPCDVENLRRHYVRTLDAWADNLETHADDARRIAGDRRFRIWRVYLAGCAKAFEDDWIALFQVLACKSGGGAMNPLPMTRKWQYEGC